MAQEPQRQSLREMRSVSEVVQLASEVQERLRHLQSRLGRPSADRQLQHPLLVGLVSADHPQQAVVKARRLLVLVGRARQLQVLVDQVQQLPVLPWLQQDSDKVQQRVQWALVDSVVLVPLQQAGTRSKSRRSTARRALRSRSTATRKTRTSASALKWKTVSLILHPCSMNTSRVIFLAVLTLSFVLLISTQYC